MIAHLAGTLLEKHVQRLVVDVGGVGYDVHVPLSTFYAVGEPGARVTLRVHTHVREDALQLFGFVTALELSLFQRLISVSGIGPKVALAVLSGIEPADLIRGWERLRETGAPFVASVVAEARPIHRSFVLDGGRIHWLFPQYAASRTQDLPTVYCDAGQFYWGTTRAWLTADAILGPDTATVILPAERVIDIDTEHDWQIAEQRYLASSSAGCPTT